jgi:hypothetical protein
MELIPNVGGRPVISLSEDQINEISALASVLTKGQLADYYGMSENTFRAVEERQPEVFEAYKKGRARAISTVAGNLIKQAANGNTSAAIFYLKTQAGWKEQEPTAIVGQFDNVIKIIRATNPD